MNPMPANGGQDCVGSAEEQQVCNIGNCPGMYIAQTCLCIKQRFLKAIKMIIFR